MYSRSFRQKQVRCATQSIAIAMLGASLLVALQRPVWGYTKANTYRTDDGTIVFRDHGMASPHSWAIAKAIDLLRHDGYHAEAQLAQRYLLPTLEGAMFNDIWGDADYAGASVLDYYCPSRQDQNYGFGSAAFAYKNATWDFQNHRFYGYGNAAEHAQFRYDYAKRVYLGHWGDDPRDWMAGWVIDSWGGQNDPMDGRWARDANAINGQRRFGTDPDTGRIYTPAEVLQDLLANHCTSQDVFPKQEGSEWLYKIFVPKKEVFDHEPEWLDDHFTDADDIEVYSGFDGVTSAVYANWTDDPGAAWPPTKDSCMLLFCVGDCPKFAECAAFVFKVPVNSPEHSFFLLGWAMHLLADCTLPIHTTDSSLTALEVHCDIESYIDRVFALPQEAEYIYTDPSGQPHVIMDSLPALSLTNFQALYPWPPPECADRTVNPSDYFKQRWYVDTLSHYDGEGVAHAYARQSAEMAHTYMPYISCINTEDHKNWQYFGFFSALALDNAAKSIAGLLHQFLKEVGANDQAPPAVTLTPLSPDPTTDNTPTLSGTATDAGSNIKSVEYSLDGGATWWPAAASDGAFDSMTEGFTFTPAALADGTHTLRVRATDVSDNVTGADGYASDTFLIDTTPPVIAIVQPTASQYPHSATLALNYTVSDGIGSGVQSVTPKMDGATTLAGHGLASGQTINLLTELPLGQHTFTVDAVDNVNLSATESVTFTIIVTAQSIQDGVGQFVTGGKITQDGGRSFLSKLEAAAKARAKGDFATAANIYTAFINEVQAQNGKKIDPMAAEILIADAQYLITH